jgi:PIN domain nuclease of toxin-antitoxin system
VAPCHGRIAIHSNRLLISQALEEDFDILSRDAIFEEYGARRIW